MKHLLLLLTIFISTISSAKACVVDYAQSEYIIGNGNSVAFFDRINNCLSINSEKSFHAFPLNKTTDIPLNLKIEFSNNDKFLLLSYALDDSGRKTVIISLDNLSVLHEQLVSYSFWVENIVYMLPPYQLEDLPTVGGFITFDPISNVTKVVAESYVFTGKMVNNDGYILADVLEKKDALFFTKTILLDITDLVVIQQFN